LSGVFYCVFRAASSKPDILTFISFPEQAVPNGDFPTVKSQIRRAGALAMALALADKSRYCCGTDPDCDRLGIAVRNNEGK
jgi:phosphomannomutase